MLNEILSSRHNLLIMQNKINDLPITNKNQCHITHYFRDSKEEKWMRDVYTIITTTSLKTPTYWAIEKELFALSFPVDFINEVLHFKNMKNYINQFKLNIILQTISKREYVGDILHYFNPSSLQEYPITYDIVEFYQKHKDDILKALIYEFIMQNFGAMLDDDAQALTSFEEDNFNTFINSIKRLYKNPFNRNNIDFPCSDTQLKSFVENIYKIVDKENIDSSNLLVNEFVQIINQMIQPLVSIDVHYVFRILLSNKLYEEYERLYQIRRNEKCQINLYIFLTQLYIKISGQPRMSFMGVQEDTKIYRFFDTKETIKKYALYEWANKNNQFDFVCIDIQAILNSKESQKYKKIPAKTTVEIGDKYEKFCMKWLKKMGYINIEQIAGAFDKGVDILAINTGGQKVGVQCKYKSEGAIDSKTIREFSTSKEYYKVDKLLLLSTVPVTKEANYDAKKLEIDTFIVHFDI